jgi:tryptophanyl-tRNA synthetase
LISIVGWHALTLPQNAKELSTSRTDMLATLLAFGINPKRTILFYQEDVGLNPFIHLIWSLSHV